MCFTALALGASAIGGIAQASAAKKAASAQKAASDDSIALQREIYGDQVERFQPYYDQGTNALAALNYELGLTDTAPEGYTGYEASAGYKNQLAEGLNAIEGSAAARGGLFSGNTAKAITGYSQDLADADFSNYLNRLTGMSGTGLSAAGLTANAAQNYASGTTNALNSGANATAAGYIGQGNALSGTLNSLIGIGGYQNFLNSGVTPQAQYNAFTQGGGLY